MPYSESNTEKNSTDALRRFINRLEEWPEDAPPSLAELGALRREIYLNEKNRKKLELLADNHIRRARNALAEGAYAQATAELARASQLRPMDARPRIELAAIYLQRSLERGYSRNDRQQALKLAHKALELNPGNMEARQFLHDYHKMNADFMAARYKRFLVPVILFIGIMVLAIWWQKDFVFSVFTTQTNIPNQMAKKHSARPVSASRNVIIDTTAVSNGNLNTEIISATVGRKNDSFYVSILGRLEVSEKNLGPLELVLRGRDSDGDMVFSIPWIVRDASDPVLIPGDSETLVLFHWLADSPVSIQRLELAPDDMNEFVDNSGIASFQPDLIWAIPRPEGATLGAEIRNMEISEAYDRQILSMDLAVHNAGETALSVLVLGISLGSDLPEFVKNTVIGTDPPLIMGERRVWSIAMGLPLDTDISGRTVTVSVKGARR